jgi:predicted KAP-like P-loop ATPase
MTSSIVSLVMDYMVLILVWCPYVASASASLLSTSFDKIEKTKFTTTGRNIVIDSSIESDSHSDPLTRYLEGDNGTGQNKFDMNSRSMLLVWKFFCLIIDKVCAK